ncbi:hypothetical protein [Azonexus sp.]|uniref:hypothetical protein n=1 Tax=Azonexus sp. TaxID=1872668 RepID=UPI0035B017F3
MVGKIGIETDDPSLRILSSRQAISALLLERRPPETKAVLLADSTSECCCRWGAGQRQLFRLNGPWNFDQQLAAIGQEPSLTAGSRNLPVSGWGREQKVVHVPFEPACFQTPVPGCGKMPFELIGADVVKRAVPVFMLDLIRYKTAWPLRKPSAQAVSRKARPARLSGNQPSYAAILLFELKR